ncbi:MAG: methyl-accepting chemotaxis protein [Bacillales bacterium]|jgi:methyl-accepting chemotaxis protein|nr:methyl-accepting chemotaxis protein [Bacillales bacterium]
MNLKKFSLKKLLVSGFLSIVFLFLCSTGYVWYLNGEIDELAHVEEQRITDREKVLQLETYIGILYSNQADLIINENPDLIKEYQENETQFKKLVDSVVIAVDTGEEAEWGKELQKASLEYVAVFDKVVHTFNNSRNYTPAELKEQYKKLDYETDLHKVKLFDLSGKLSKSFNEELKIAKEDLHADLDASNLNIIISSIIITALSVGIALYITSIIVTPLRSVVDIASKVSEGDLTQNVTVNVGGETGQLVASFNKMIEDLRYLISRINENAETISASAQQLTASSEQTTEAAEQVASSIQEVANASESQLRSTSECVDKITNISLGINTITESASLANESSLNATNFAKDGNEAIKSAISQMENISVSVNHTSDGVKELYDRSKEIDAITKIITGIAEQTNLLALNAAIEAARAGEHGRGFAVVADEVRKLAEQSKDAAEQISTLITQIQKSTRSAVETMENGTKEVVIGKEIMSKAGEIFGQIYQTIEEIGERIQGVSTTSKDINSFSDHCSSLFDELLLNSKNSAANSQDVAAATEEQLATMQEIASSSNMLSQLSIELQDTVQSFKLK